MRQVKMDREEHKSTSRRDKLSMLGQSSKNEMVAYHRFKHFISVFDNVTEFFIQPRMIEIFSENVSHLDFSEFSEVLLTLSIYGRLEGQLLEVAIAREIANTREKETLFRGQNLYVQILSKFFYIKGRAYLIQFLRPFLLNVVFYAEGMEIHPKKMSPEEVPEIPHRLERIRNMVLEFLYLISCSYEKLPQELAHILFQLKQLVNQTFPDFGLKSVANFFLLRFVCPALTSPYRYGLLEADEHCNGAAQRILILLSKIITNLANQVPFGLKESYMEPLNDLLEDADDLLSDVLVIFSTQVTAVRSHQQGNFIEDAKWSEKVQQIVYKSVSHSFVYLFEHVCRIRSKMEKGLMALGEEEGMSWVARFNQQLDALAKAIESHEDMFQKLMDPIEALQNLLQVEHRDLKPSHYQAIQRPSFNFSEMLYSWEVDRHSECERDVESLREALAREGDMIRNLESSLLHSDILASDEAQQVIKSKVNHLFDKLEASKAELLKFQDSFLIDK